eukprot:6185333-Pleurochrysis_carterae.AAC.1
MAEARASLTPANRTAMSSVGSVHMQLRGASASARAMAERMRPSCSGKCISVSAASARPSARHRSANAERSSE